MRSASSTRPGPRSSPDPLELRGVSFAYGGGRGGEAALRDVDLRARRGEVLGLLGRNGSGKTTLLRLAAGLARADRGRLRVLGAEAPPGPAVRARVAFVPDRLAFAEPLPGREHAVRMTALRGGRRERAAAAADAWLTRFGLVEAAVDPVGTYSAGMRRKLALVEAFAAAPELLLLDEPLAALDPEARETLRTALREAVADGAAAVLSVHEPGYAAQTCDRVAFLRDGAPVGGGRPEALVRGLDLPTRVRVEGDGPEPATPPPSPWRLVHLEGDVLRLASPDGARGLPDLCAWLVGAGVAIRSLSVHEPGLGDVYLALAGAPLEEASAGPERGSDGGREGAGSGRGPRLG